MIMEKKLNKYSWEVIKTAASNVKIEIIEELKKSMGEKPIEGIGVHVKT